MEKNSYPTHWIKCGPKTPLIIWCLCQSLLELCFSFELCISSVIKCSSMMRKSRRAVWIWCFVDCLRNFLWDYLQLCPCLFYFYLDLHYIRLSSDLCPHVVVGREIFNVWCYFLCSCSDEVASIMSGLMKIVYDFTCNLLSRSYVFRHYFFWINLLSQPYDFQINLQNLN